jgi:3-hydroxyisobutyrate dehydrogenase-like beta-hydroxyacid dehydrogenase
VSPGRKQNSAKELGDAARYVDVAIIAPIYPARHQTPMLIAGSDAQALLPVLTGLGMRVSVSGAEVGAAAAIKMVRSVMIKGLEALTLECFLAAARAGIVDEVAVSMKNNYPGLDWAKIVPYNLERMANHGERRAAEMEESAETLRELGVEPLMTSATVRRQREMGQIGTQQSVRVVLDKDRAAMLNAISAAAQDRH